MKAKVTNKDLRTSESTSQRKCATHIPIDAKEEILKELVEYKDSTVLHPENRVSQHINRNAEKFRNKFVKHEGQKELIIKVDGILGNWPEIVNRIVAAADNNVEKIDLRNLLECCSFKKIKFRIRFLVEPIIWNLVATYRGEIDEDFWGRIVWIDQVFGLVVVLIFLDGVDELLSLFGFIGANQEVLEDSDDESVVSPVIGWSVVDGIKVSYELFM
ncbi:41493_t:CDS:2 [Gigaspora margarita]|uniref:41493_t:CDS:1 n=1 Tax=Gigaspora margarita TaxID=4874 RepID=A0ABN7UPZ7_GIGMA|nr:41493_t:CDS:2 [Gigaspora margarita]